MKFSSNMEQMWRLWAKSLGEKAHPKNHLADRVAVIRTIIFITYLITNCFIVAGVIRHWNDREINVEVEIYENQNYSEKLYPKGWNTMGMDGNTRIEGVYSSGTIKKAGEFE
jgi:hypothetical protein